MYRFFSYTIFLKVIKNHSSFKVVSGLRITIISNQVFKDV